MDVNDSLRNTEMCIDYDPQLCYKTNTVSCVNKESSVYKKLSCNIALKACAAATAAALVVVLLLLPLPLSTPCLGNLP